MLIAKQIAQRVVHQEHSKAVPLIFEKSVNRLLTDFFMHLILGVTIVIMSEVKGVPSDWQKQAQQNQKTYHHLLQKGHKNLMLAQLPTLNEEAFSKIDCL